LRAATSSPRRFLGLKAFGSQQPHSGCQTDAVF
jgi:hypothetical protein